MARRFKPRGTAKRSRSRKYKRTAQRQPRSAIAQRVGYRM